MGAVTPSTNRPKTAVVVLNTALALFIVGALGAGIYRERSDLDVLARYGSVPTPLGDYLVQTLRMEARDIVLVIVLACGAIAELRRRKLAAVLNPLVYSLLMAGVIWIAVSVALSPFDSESLIALIVSVPLALPAIIGLALYRREIAGNCSRLHGLLRRRGHHPGSSGVTGRSTDVD
jgi:hypothetical protein